MSLSLCEWGQVAVITVKEVSQKECRPPHSHLHYLSTCQSICLFAIETDKLHLQRKHVSHVQCNEEKRHPKCGTLISNFSFVRHFPSVSNYYSCKIQNSSIFQFKYFIKAVWQTVIRLTAQSPSLEHLSLTLIRIPFQMSSQFLFSRTKHRMNKNRSGETSLETRRARDYMSNCSSALLIRH